MKSDYRIYSKEDNRQKGFSYIYLFFLAIGISCLIIYGWKFWDFDSSFSTDHKLWTETFTILSTIVSIIAFGALIITFKEGQKAIKKANTLPVCIEIFKELRSESFLNYEKIIMTKLSKESEPVEISAIKDPELRYAVRSYLHIMNNISALVIHNIVDDEPIIAYKGCDILYYFDLLYPYIIKSRKELKENINNESRLSEEVRNILNDASHLNYAHYELFMNQIKSRSSYLIKKFDSNLANHRNRLLAFHYDRF